MLKLMKYMHAHCTAIYMMLLMIDKKYVKPFTHCSKLIRSLLYFKITVYPQPNIHIIMQIQNGSICVNQNQLKI